MAVISLCSFILMMLALGCRLSTLVAAAPQFWNDILPADQPVCPVLPEPEWAKALGTPRDFASHIFGKVVWDPKKFAKPFTIFLMIGEEEWHCVEGFQPVPGHLTGNLYDALPTILQYPDRATSLVDETKMFDPDFQRRLHPDGTITMNGNRGTLIEYATGGDIKSDIVEVRHATPPTGSRDDLSALPFDWQALALPTVARAENREVFPSIWRVNTVGRHPSGTCTETSLGRYPIAAQYWVYWDRPGRICK